MKKVAFRGCTKFPSALHKKRYATLHFAYTNFFRRCKQGVKKKGFPRYKSRKNGGSERFG